MILKIRDVIELCDDKKPRSRKWEKVDRLVVHRIGESLGHDAISISEKFNDQSKYAAGSYTGGNVPYHFFIPKSGTVEQALELGDNAPHARRFNARALAVACIGDFRVEKPTQAQYQSLTEICGLFRLLGLSIWGHSELPGGRSNASKQCPGPLLDMSQLRVDADRAASDWRDHLLSMHGIRK